MKLSLTQICAGIFFFILSSTPADSLAPLIIVYDRGSMKEALRDNGAAKVNLAELKDKEHLYALGPIAKLKGEILIWDSHPYESQISDGAVKTRSTWDDKAAYLVWASNSKWQKTKVPSSARGTEFLELWMHSMSGREGAPLREQYPFLIKGKFAWIDWHISNAPDDGKPLTPEQLHAQYHGRSKFVKAELLGFYSPNHQGLFIPAGRRTHIHMKVNDDLVAHVDDFEPMDEAQLTLYVPGR